jgi:hypothetical protein
VPGKLTQKDRVLRALRNARGRGVTRVDFLSPNVIDGGTPILNPPARVEELRKDGHHILNAGLRDDCTIYTLAPPAEPWEPIPTDPAPAATDSGELISLFDEQVGQADPPTPYDAPDAA